MYHCKECDLYFCEYCVKLSKIIAQLKVIPLEVNNHNKDLLNDNPNSLVDSLYSHIRFLEDKLT